MAEVGSKRNDKQIRSKRTGAKDLTIVNGIGIGIGIDEERDS